MDAFIFEFFQMSRISEEGSDEQIPIQGEKLSLQLEAIWYFGKNRSSFMISLLE